MNEKLTIIIPCYNEANFVGKVLDKVFAVILPGDMTREVIVVDDNSNDGTGFVVERYIKANPARGIIVLTHEHNYGKGAAIRTGIRKASGDFIVIQDADLEYDPAEYPKLLKPVLDGHADVVYGSRFRGSEAHRVLFFLHSAGNKFLTFLSNMCTGLNLTDMETGSKLFRRDILQSLTLEETRFGFEPEVTARISKIKDLRIYEIGISYYGRTYSDGKKIRWTDGVRALYCIIKYNLFRRK